MTTAPTKSEVDIEKQKILAKDQEFRGASIAAAQRRELRKAEIESIEATHAHQIKRFNLTNSHVAWLNREIERRFMAAAVDNFSSTSETVSLADVADLAQLQAEREYLLRLITIGGETILPETEELLQVAREQYEIATAEHLEATVALREFRLTTSLAPILESEGNLVVDMAGTVSGELKRQAAQARLLASNMREQITERQRVRAGKKVTGGKY